MFVKRDVGYYLKDLSKQYSIITLTGPRQSGKTTLCKYIFPDKPYVSLENLDVRAQIQKDPNAFLERFPDGAILDEVQRVPDILSYIQTIVDEKKKAGMFILTGSSQFELLSNISQSLAGRTALVNLMPFSIAELKAAKIDISLEKLIFSGFYPAIFSNNLSPTQWLSFYVSTYLERDVRNLLNIKDLAKFELFIKICAGRTGQILNLLSISNECGINHNTAKSWLGILEASYVVRLVQPHHKNFNKRLIKAPKLYFIDVGLAVYLLDIFEEQQLFTHPLRGALFETLVVSEILKSRYNKVKQPNLYYFRDNVGNEVDLLLDFGTKIVPIEIKSSKTITDSFFKGLNYYKKLNPKGVEEMFLIYAGTKVSEQDGVFVRSYKDLSKIYELV